MNRMQNLQQVLTDTLAEKITSSTIDRGELTVEVAAEDILEVAKILRDDSRFGFEQAMDVCGVDYLQWGQEAAREMVKPARFAVVYHLLSIRNNWRLRLRVWLDDKMPMLPSVVGIWSGVDWFEREAFDLFGIVFEGHPDLRRILTDYGFIGHPFRKDFPLTGKVEVRYDPDKGSVVYEPVSLQPRILTPRIIREENFGG
ncbi:MAG TPA: NADH-quinone oxidoreductase subunit C [Gammaproteobacteria bacterium]|nr:NADH-quinone oxidoreductase subunit C [Gammaproteobacteria bacterium]